MVETTSTVIGLSEINPTGQEFRTEGDDHLRLLKRTIKHTLQSDDGFGLTGPVTANHNDLSATAGAGVKHLAGKTLQAQIDDLNNGIYSIPSDQYIGFGGDGSPSNQTFAIGFTDSDAGGYKALLITTGEELDDLYGGIALYGPGSGVSERIVMGWQPKCFIDMTATSYKNEDLVNKGYVASEINSIFVNLQGQINALSARVTALENA